MTINRYSPIPVDWVSELFKSGEKITGECLEELFTKNESFALYDLSSLSDDLYEWDVKDFKKANKNLSDKDLIYLNDLHVTVDKAGVVDQETFLDALGTERSEWRNKFSRYDAPEKTQEWYQDDLVGINKAEKSLEKSMSDCDSVELDFLSARMDVLNAFNFKLNVKKVREYIDMTFKSIVINLCGTHGGSGKTTTAVSIADWFVRYGFRTLLVDSDGQGNATVTRSDVSIGSDAASRDYVSLTDVLNGTKDINQAIIPGNQDNLYVLPASTDIGMFISNEGEEVGKPLKCESFREAFHQIAEPFDIIVIDSPPSDGLIITSSLVATDYVILPLQPEYYANTGAERFLDKIERIQSSGKNSALKVLGYVVTHYNNRSKDNKENMMNYYYQYEEDLGIHWLGTVSNKKTMSEQAINLEPVYKFAPRTNSNRENQALFEQLLRRIVEDNSDLLKVEIGNEIEETEAVQ